MARTSVTCLLGLILGLPLFGEPLKAKPPASSEPGSSSEKVASLVKQLGSPKYAVRSAAQRELAQIGLVAFDALDAALESDDPEIVSASRFLLDQMTIHWGHPEDTVAVRTRLEHYGRLEAPGRIDAVTELAGLPDYSGIGSLCWIARFDLSRLVARKAAVVALGCEDYHVPTSQSEAIARGVRGLDSQFGRSQRRAVHWLRLFVSASEDSAAVVDAWREEVRSQHDALESARNEGDPQVLNSLHWILLRVELGAKSGRPEQVAELVERLVDFDLRSRHAVLTRAMEWMADAGADEEINAVAKRLSERFQSKRGLYLMAMTRHRQGRLEQAERLSALAFEAEPEESDRFEQNGQLVLNGRLLLARTLDAAGHFEWARKEYHASLAKTPSLSVNGVYARWLLADSLQDHQQYGEAAKELAEIVAMINAEPANQQAHLKLVERWGSFLQPLHVLQAREAYYRALDCRDRGDISAEREALLKAIAHDPLDADIVIAMHRVSGAGDSWREEVQQRIRDLALEFQEQIDEDPTEPMGYNQWAWLIANTEGDYEKAARYSKLSLRLRPGNAGYLDTLGRCYYAAGNLEKAVEKQREAVRLEPHIQVLRRQLATFEKELAGQSTTPP